MIVRVLNFGVTATKTFPPTMENIKKEKKRKREKRINLVLGHLPHIICLTAR